MDFIAIFRCRDPAVGPAAVGPAAAVGPRAAVGLRVAMGLALLLATTTACKQVEFESTWMDAEGTEDPSLSDPSYLVSTALPAPTADERATPVVILVHGFGASTFEWADFRDEGRDRGLLISSVLLGGHGRSISAWEGTNWGDWAAPVLDEYIALRKKGFENIVFATASTGGTLLMQLLYLDAFRAFGPPQGVVMVAPLLVPKNKLLYQARFVGWAINNSPSGLNDEEKKIFYYNRPHTVFYPLLDLIEKMEADLKGVIQLPEGMPLHIFQADGDMAVDVASLDLWRAGLAPGEQIEITEVDSDLHVFTREVARDTWSDDDEELQMLVFDRIEEMAWTGR